jgi:hypothetical protein
LVEEASIVFDKNHVNLDANEGYNDKTAKDVNYVAETSLSFELCNSILLHLVFRLPLELNDIYDAAHITSYDWLSEG